MPCRRSEFHRRGTATHSARAKVRSQGTKTERGQETLHPRGGTPANNPLACFVGFSGGERTPLPRHQETKETTKELRRVSHPFHVSDHRGAFPVAEVPEADLRILPDRAGLESAEIRRDLTVDPHLFVPTQFVFDARYQHRFVISLRHTPMARYRYDVVRKVLQRLEHDVLLNRRVVIVSSPSVLVQETKVTGVLHLTRTAH